MASSYRFKARYRGLAFSALGIGGALGVVSVIALGAAMLPLATGIAGVLLGGGYLVSPTWKIEIVVDDDGYRIRTPKGDKFNVKWAEVQRVVASPTTKTCFVDLKDPTRNFLVPGDGAPAPYDIENKDALYDEIMAHVPKDKVEEVSTIEAAKKAASARV